MIDEDRVADAVPYPFVSTVLECDDRRRALVAESDHAIDQSPWFQKALAADRTGVVQILRSPGHHRLHLRRSARSRRDDGRVASKRRRGAGDDPPVALGRDGGPARYDGARQDV